MNKNPAFVVLLQCAMPMVHYINIDLIHLRFAGENFQMEI
jgi:hypothetical protein